MLEQEEATMKCPHCQQKIDNKTINYVDVLTDGVFDLMMLYARMLLRMVLAFLIVGTPIIVLIAIVSIVS